MHPNRAQVGQAHNEKRILESINFPFVVRMEFFYQDNSYLYFVMPFACGGNITMYLSRNGPMDEDKARFYASGILLAVEYLQTLDLAHRDIKSDNVLIGLDGHSQLADFGFCKHVPGRTYTLCGTYDYIAPEIINGQGYGKAADFWSMGIVLFEMVAGYTPFSGHSVGDTLSKITAGRYSCPAGFSGDLINLMRNVLRVDATKRYGNLANGVRDLKKHRWFGPIDWCAFIRKQVAPPFSLTLQGGWDPEDCTANFKSANPDGLQLSVSSTESHGDLFKHF